LEVPLDSISHTCTDNYHPNARQFWFWLTGNTQGGHDDSRFGIASRQ